MPWESVRETDRLLSEDEVMVPILVLATFVVIVLAQLFILSRRKKAAEVARAHSMIPIAEGVPPTLPLPNFLFHPGHTWVYVHDDNLVSVGATEFASNFAGHLASVNVPREGARLRQGESAWTLVSARDRRLKQTMPIDGKVVAVNRELLEDPDLANNSPYEKGWILRVRPRDLQSSIRNLLTEAAARAWIDATQAKITAQLSPALGAVAQDGGEWSSGFGDRLEDTDWETLRRDLFPSTVAVP